MVNRDLVMKILDKIEEDQAHWDQSSFTNFDSWAVGEANVCNSTFCFAGFAAVLSNRVGVIKTGNGSYSYLTATDKYGGPSTWETVAMELLGFNDAQVDSVFFTVTDDFEVFKDHVLWVIDHPDDEDELYERKNMINDRVAYD